MIFSYVEKFLKSSKEEAEVWIVNLIISLNLQAKIGIDKVEIVKVRENFIKDVIIFIYFYVKKIF